MDTFKWDEYTGQNEHSRRGLVFLLFPLDKEFDYFWFKRVDWKMYMYINKQHFKIFVVLGNSLDLDSRLLNP